MRFGSEISAYIRRWPVHQITKSPIQTSCCQRLLDTLRMEDRHTQPYYPAICTNFQVTSLEILSTSASYVRTDLNLPLFNPMPLQAKDGLEPRCLAPGTVRQDRKSVV